MAQHIIEGTWEEIKRHEAEFAGHMLRVIVKPIPSERRKSAAKTGEVAEAPKVRVLRGMGAFKGMTGGSETFAEEKRAEVEREERDW